MPDQTPLLGVPYPLPEDAVTDYPGVGRDLAETVEDLLKAPSCRAYSTAALSLPNGATTVLPLNAERWDSPHPNGGGMHDGTSAAPGRIYAPRAGVYVVTLGLYLTVPAAPTSLNSYARIRHQNVNYVGDSMIPWTMAAPALLLARMTLSTIVALALSEMVEAIVYNGSGQAASVPASPMIGPEFSVAWLGPIPAGAIAHDGLPWDEPRPELEPLDYNATLLEADELPA